MWSTLDPPERLLNRFHLPEPEAGVDVLGVGKGAIGHGFRPAREPHALALATGVQSLPGQHDTGLHELLVEVSHLAEQLLAWHHTCFGVLCRLDEHDNSHRSLLGSRGGRAELAAPLSFTCSRSILESSEERRNRQIIGQRPERRYLSAALCGARPSHPPRDPSAAANRDTLPA